MAKKKSAAKKTEPKFEDALTNLEGIVADLETGNLPLTESIQRYEEGVKLLKQCQAARAACPNSRGAKATTCIVVPQHTMFSAHRCLFSDTSSFTPSTPTTTLKS